MFKQAIPVLHVSDAAVAEAFYCGMLGFELQFAYRVDEALANPCYMGLCRDRCVIHVSSFSGDAVAGGVVYLMVEDVDGVFGELRGKGVTVALEPTDQSWGNREMYVKDADGNTIRFVG